MFHLRHLIGEDGVNCSYKTPTNGKNASFEVSRDLGALLRHSVSLPTKSYVLNIPSNAEFIDEENEAEKRLPNSTFNVERNLQIVAPPSIFATHAIARAIVSRFAPLLSSKENNEEAQQLQLDNQQDGNDEKKPNSQIVSINLHCLFSVLWQLSRRDPELCVQAMSSLLSMLQCLPPESLSNEPKSAIRDMHETLKRLRIEGSSAVSSLASACLSALSISSASPEFLFSTTAAFLCDNLTGTMSTSADLDLIQIPENHHRLGIYIQNRIFNGNETGIDWCSLPLTSLCVLSNFDMSTLPIEFSPTTPDEDRRLFSASASDGAYLYVLTYLGLFKMGTGLGETVIGKLYASNTMMRASRNCVLSLCQSSLYLRRGQSSRVWVLDTGTLREIGEIILPPESTQTAIFTDGDNFFQATVDQHSTLVITSLNDSFVPSTDPKAKQKYRLTEVSYSTFGDIEAIPNALPNTLPATLQNQAVDLHMGSDCAFLLARSGKVFYSGNGMRLGLQETGTTWMELVLPEPIVQLCVGSELVLFRSGGGHIWMAGGEERNRQQKHGKLRRIQTSNRRKTIGIAACGACFAYVTENGRVYAMGRHGMRTHPETGLVAGLEGVHLVSIALGKTHAAAVSRHGFLFTWGLNNLHQCGRVEASSTSTSPFSTPHQPMKSGGIKQKKQEQQEKDDPNAPLTSICPPNEHLFVKDVASVCIQCAQCSARGVSCNRSNAVKPGDLCPCGPGETACLRCGICRLCGDAEVGISNPENLHQDDTHGTSHKIILAPARVQLAKTGIDTKVAMVSCGNFHTIVLGADRSVYTFGSNCHGQLGVGDTKRHLGPCRIELPQSVQVVQVGAGSNHCVLRTSDGQVWTFGAHKQGQLGRDSSDPLWHCRPQAVPGFGPQSGILATWIGCVGDVTIVHSARSLFTHESIQDAQIIANKSCLFVFPREAGKDYVVIRRRQHTFAHHQLGPVGLYTSWCVDQEHSVIWSYSAAEMRVQGFIEAKGLSESEAQKENDDLCLLRNAEYFNPSETESKLSSTQMALSLLSSTYALSIMSLKPINHKEASNLSRIDSSTLLHEGYSVINRFEGHGGGWGYSAHSVEAIQFRVSRQIRLLGVGLFWWTRGIYCKNSNPSFDRQ
ncbi:unnamed protein product, partial [Mesorhabditis belari]|uniref:PHR domain-containing protein n=1 Tax=Mesorhabditis belari TaxID=2138241 RepID=A0AAF3ESQ3_9BILA